MTSRLAAAKLGRLMFSQLVRREIVIGKHVFRTPVRELQFSLVHVV